MADGDVQVRFSADPSGLIDGSSQAKAALADLGPALQTLSASIEDLAVTLASGVQALGQIGQAMRQAGSGAAGQLQPAVNAVRTIGQAMAGLGRSAPGDLQAAGEAAGGLGSTLSAAGVEGVAGLAAVADAAIPVLLVISTLVEGVADVTNAVTQWAARTVDSATASAQAKQAATALNAAAGQTQAVFNQIADVMGTALAPAVTAVVGEIGKLAQGLLDNYNAGGLARTAVDALAIAFKTAVTVISVLVSSLKWFADAAKFAYESVAGLVDLFLGRVPQAFAQAGAQLSTLTGLAKDAAAALNFLGQVWGKAANLPPLPSAGGQGAGSQPSAGGKAAATSGGGGGGRASSGAAAGEDALQKLREGFEESEAAHRSMISNMQADELAYWQTVQKSSAFATLNNRQQSEVRLQISKLESAQSIQAIQDEIAERRDADARAIASIQEQQTAFKAATDQRIKATEDAEKQGLITHQAATDKIIDLIHQEEQSQLDAADKIKAIRIATDDYIMAHAAEGTTEFKAAKKDETDAEDQAAKARVQIVDQAQAQIDARIKQSADAFKQSWDAAVNPLVSSFTSGLVQMAEGAKSFSQVMRGIGQQILDDFLRNVVDKMIERWLWSEEQRVLATINAAALRAAVESTSQGFINGLEFLGLAKHTTVEVAKTASTTAGVAARTSVQSAGAAAGLAISGTAALKDIINSAASAGAAAYKAMSGIPIIGPILGAAAAAAVFAGAIVFKGLVSSAEGGWGQVPFDNLPTLLHANEMVLPARLANPLRSMLDSYSAASSSRPETTAAENTHNHLHLNVSAIDGQSVLNHIRTNKDAYQTAFGEMVRGGMARKMGLAVA